MKKNSPSTRNVTFIQRMLNRINKKRIKWSEIYLGAAGALHRLLVEGRRKRAAARRQQQDLPLSVLTSMKLEPGDIVYTPSSESTYYAGHMGIIGLDGKVYHVHPYGPVFADTLDWYLTRFYEGDRFIVFRSRLRQVGDRAAEWVEDHYRQVKHYRLQTDLLSIERNYCSKFIYQAYKFTSGVDLWGRRFSKIKQGFIYPFRIERSADLDVLGTFYK
ncbi:hypothetical protein KQI74_09405 [Paenibacillus barcinonensis]|jgi:uncharacterized protein YycO|uniref:hypothetical protein n=1 Tax=Paenibacillus barcinonensis TaxID=198119 RepID=UPI001C119FC2|nr:hypothetical protein [Paenibacillus barcinonensis]MBU5352495.1 hypothetical protein [Paenibacillus barcinonensis]